MGRETTCDCTWASCRGRIFRSVRGPRTSALSDTGASTARRESNEEIDQRLEIGASREVGVQHGAVLLLHRFERYRGETELDEHVVHHQPTRAAVPVLERMDANDLR